MVKRESKSWYVTGFFLVLFGLCIIVLSYISEQKEINIEKENLDKFYKVNSTENFNQEIKKEKHHESNNQVVDYLAVVKIPKINLEKGLYQLSSSFNNVDKNIEILKDSDMPDVMNGNFILAGHSGTAKISYFKNLYKLKLGDEIVVYYDRVKYKYKITNIYLIDKTGEAVIRRNTDKTSITLITCKSKSDNQYVFIGELE